MESLDWTIGCLALDGKPLLEVEKKPGVGRNLVDEVVRGLVLPRACAFVTDKVRLHCCRAVGLVRVGELVEVISRLETGVAFVILLNRFGL